MTKKHFKIFILLSVIVTLFRDGWFFWSWVFAQTTTATESQQKIIEFIDIILKLFSRWRVILASLAGKMMSNDLVYWSAFRFDVFLWTLRNITKNIANFAIWFLLLYHVLNSFINPWSWPAELKKKIPQLFIAWVLIQISWFLVAAMIDLSTIATAAVWSFPQVVLNGENWAQLKNEINKQMSKIPKKMTRNYNKDNPNKTEIKTSQETIAFEDGESAFDLIIPKADYIAGPLIYLWVSIFRFQHFSFLSPDQVFSSSVLISMMIKLALSLIFMIPLLWLFIFNVVRVFALRVLIAFSPIIVLFYAIDNKSKSLPDRFSRWELISLIFQPVISVGILSIILIIITGMTSVINNNTWSSRDRDGVRFSNEPKGTTTIDIGPSEEKSIFKGTIEGDIFTESGSSLWLVADLIVMFFTGFLLWMLSALTFKMGWSIAWSVASKVTKPLEELGETAARSVPIIPGWLSLNAAERLQSEYWWRNSKILRDISTTSNETVNDIIEELRWSLWLEKDLLTVSEESIIKKNLNNLIAQPTNRKEGTKNVLSTLLKDGNIEDLFNNPKTFNLIYKERATAIANNTEGERWLMNQLWPTEFNELFSVTDGKRKAAKEADYFLDQGRWTNFWNLIEQLKNNPENTLKATNKITNIKILSRPTNS